MATPPGPVTVKVAALIVAGFITSLKVAVNELLVGTLVAPLAGVVELTVGAVRIEPEPVENVQT
jgi:hypothetical protein